MTSVNGGKHKNNDIQNNMKCSPHPSGEAHSLSESKSCYSNNSLETLKDAWNARHSDEKITSR